MPGLRTLVDLTRRELLRRLNEEHGAKRLRARANDLLDSGTETAWGLALLARTCLNDALLELALHLARLSDRTRAPSDYNNATRIMALSRLGSADVVDEAGLPADWTESRIALAMHCYANREYGNAERWLATLKRRSRTPADSAHFKKYLAARRSFPDAEITFGILSYGSPDARTVSRNLGDYIQTIAMMRHLARYYTPGLWKIGNARTAKLLDHLAESWPADQRRSSGRRISMAMIDRDCMSASLRSHDGSRIWAFLYGYYALPPFGMKTSFPPPENVTSIVLSFHVSSSEMLTPATVDYLKRVAPIGCRDWNTAWLLLNQGIAAYFSGCITQTLVSVSGRESKRPSGGAYSVDSQGSHTANMKKLVHHDPVIGDRSTEENLDRAMKYLERYEAADQITTGRLHCYLPARALGTEVAFEPKRSSDPRYDGLVGLTDREVLANAERLSKSLDQAVQHILKHNDVELFRTFWRKLHEKDVARARDLLTDTKSLFLRDDSNVSVSTNADGEEDDTINVALSFDGNLADQVPVMMFSVTESTSRPVVFHCLVRDVADDQIEKIKKLCQGTVHFHCPDAALDDFDFNLYKHVTLSTIDRLFLPEILSGVRKLIYLDIDLVVMDDLSALFDIDPGKLGIAACDDGVRRNPYLFDCVERVCAELSVQEANSLRRKCAASMDLLQPLFNAGVLLLDLEILRAQNMAQQVFEFCSRYGADDQAGLNLYTAGRHVRLDPKWNTMVYHVPIKSAAIVHWAGPIKPWRDRGCLERELWFQYSSALFERPWVGIN